MSEIRDRVVARLTEAQQARSAEGLRGEESVGDALALLRAAAPAPGGEVDLDAVAAVFWTFWFRHQGPDDPDARRNVFIAVSTHGFLRTRVPAEVRLPEELRAGFDPSDPAHDARFCYLVSSAHGEAVEAEDVASDGAGEGERLAALDAALDWADAAHHWLPDGHEGFVELALHSIGLRLARFQRAADPDALAAAARYAAAVCEALPDAAGLEPAARDELTQVAGVAVGTLVDAARLLGEPPLAEVERLAAALPEAALTPEIAEGLDFLRQLEAETFTWPGERELRVGAAIADAGLREHDAGRLACAVRRLRAARSRTPTEHPAHPQITAVLGQTLLGLARERGDDEAAREAAREASELRAAGPGAEAADIDLAVLDLSVALLGGSADGAADDFAHVVTDERITRYRTALAALPADAPRRYAHVALLAALTGVRAQRLKGDDPATAAELAAEAGALTEEAATGSPADFAPLGLLRLGQYTAALPIALAVLPADVPDDDEPPGGSRDDSVGSVGELTRMASLMTRLAGMRLDDPERLDADIEALRELLEESGTGDAELRAQLSATLAGALASRGARRGDPAAAGAETEEIVALLRYAQAHTSELPREVSELLASTLTTQALGTFDAEAAREAAALIASASASASSSGATAAAAPGEGPEAWLGGGWDQASLELAQAAHSAHIAFHNALQNYLMGHEPGRLARAREAALRLREITEGASEEALALMPGLDVLGDTYLDLIETVGPGGGPRPDLTDAHVDRCRSRFAACPAGHPMRFFTASTFIRALAQRANAVRAADPEHTRRMVAEAETVLAAVEAEAPEGWAGMLRTFLGVIGEGRLPTPSGPPATGTARTAESADAVESAAPVAPVLPGLPGGALDAMLASLLARASGAAGPDVWGAPELPVWFRAHGELGAAAGALGHGQPKVEEALGHLEAAVEAMAGITDRGSDQESAEHGLTTFEGDIRSIVELVLMAVTGRGAAGALRDRVRDLAAAVAERRPLDGADELDDLFRVVKGPDVDRAVELLDRGRGLLLTRRMESRTDLGALRAAHPDLAARFTGLTAQLAPDGPALPQPGMGDRSSRPEWDRLQRLRASRELDALVERIRVLPGFERFLGPLGAEQVRDLAADGPVVVLNHARRHCHALVVTERQITALRLEPEAAAVTAAARELRDAVEAINARGGARRSPGELVAAAATVRRVLAWTWHEVVRPVLDFVDFVGHGEPVPRGGDSVPGGGDFVPGSASVPGGGDFAPGSASGPGGGGSVPGSASVPGGGGSVPGGVDSVPGTASAPRGGGSAPGSAPGPGSGPAPGGGGSAPGSAPGPGSGPAPGGGGSAPGSAPGPGSASAPDGAPTPDSRPWPRIWWVPTGAFHALPLHAAECGAPDCTRGGGCGAALDAVVSSYVPGLEALAYARGRARHPDPAAPGRPLLVAEPEERLPGVAAATGYAAGLLGAGEPLIGAAATRDAVLAGLGGAPWAHFGCHAAADPAEPSGGLLRLPSGEELSVLEICRVRPGAARLAFLAACATARTAERLSDEAIHITSAFLLAGFPAAVGTLWEIGSTHAEEVTRGFYRRALRDGPGPYPDPAASTAHALHHTVRELRRRLPDRPHIWAAYVHAGS